MQREELPAMETSKGGSMSDRNTEIAKRLRETIGDLRDGENRPLSDEDMIGTCRSLYPDHTELIALRVDVDRLMALHHMPTSDRM